MTDGQNGRLLNCASHRRSVNAVVAADHVTAADAEAELGGEGKNSAAERRQVALVFGLDVGLDERHDLVERVERAREPIDEDGT